MKVAEDAPNPLVSSEADTSREAVPRRVYQKPDLIEFGNVRDLTRGASGPQGDLQGKKRVTCLPPDASIRTPGGAVAVAALRTGDLVISVDAAGRQVPAAVRRVSTTRAPASHQLVELRLEDGRVVRASPGHPTADGRLFSDLRQGDPIDGTTIAGIGSVALGGPRTYDILPEGPTGAYYADGVLIGSTLLVHVQASAREAPATV